MGASAPSPIAPIGGRFELGRRVRSGGMGDIYRARDVASDEPVAIKLLRDAGHSADRFEREISVAAELIHPNIVRHIAHGVLPTGGAYLAIEWIEGDTLLQLMRERGITVIRAVEIASAVAAGLAAAHERGIVHRDVKPSNIMIGRDGAVKLIDFGLAWAPDSNELTRTGTSLGTLGYMAPEQALARARVDARADLFALGCVLYLCLTGTHAFAAETEAETQAKILYHWPAPLRLRNPAVPVALEDLVGELLAKRPDERPPNAAAVCRRLTDLGLDGLDDQQVTKLSPSREWETMSLPDASSGPRQVVITVGPPVRAEATTVRQRLGNLARDAQLHELACGGTLLVASDDVANVDLADVLRREFPNVVVTSTTTHGARRAAAGAIDNRAVRAADLPRKSPERYRRGRLVGQGGLGRVIEAHDEHLDRPVAIKELLRRSPTGVARFRREALITARLQHPGIVPVQDVGRWPDGSPFYAMKMIAGRNLAELIADRRELSARLALLPNAIAVCDAMAYAHQQRIIHRDLKPSNVVVGEFGETMIVDWGLAKELGSDDLAGGEGPYRANATPALTQAGDVLGTPVYMAPEQARGAAVDARTDVYALGAMLYHLLVGRAPYSDSPNTTLETIASRPPRPVEHRAPDAPAELVTIVRKAMARDPDARYPSAAELVEELKRFEAGQLVSAHRYSVGDLVRRWVSRHRAVVSVAAALLTALAVTGIVSVSRIVAAERVAHNERGEAVLARQAADLENYRLRLLQAEAALERDPTEALAWLKVKGQLPADLEQQSLKLASDALSRGVARHVRRLPGEIRSLAASGSGRIVAADSTGVVTVWDGTGQPIARADLGAAASSVALSASGNQLAAGADGGGVWWWADLAGEPRRLTLPSPVAAVRFSTEDTVAIACYDGTVTFWNSANDLHTHPVHEGPIYQLAVAGATNEVVTAGHDGRIGVLSTDGTQRGWIAHDGPVSHVELFDSDRVASSGLDGWLRVWRASDGVLLHEIQLPHAVFGFSAGSGKLVAAGDAQMVHVWEPSTGALTSHPLPFHPGYAMMAPNGQSWVVGAGAAVHVVGPGHDAYVLAGHEDMVTHIVAAAPGTLVTADVTGEVRVWQLPARPAAIAHVAGVSTAPAALGDGWAVGDNDGRVQQVYPTGGTRTIGSLSSAIALVATAPGAHVVVASATAGDAAVWRNERRRDLAGAVPLHRLAVSADGGHVIGLALDGDLLIWRGDSGELLKTLPGAAGDGFVQFLNAAPRALVPGTRTGDVRAISLEGSDPVAVDIPTSGGGRALAAAVSDSQIAIAGAEGHIRVLAWDGSVVADLDGRAGVVHALAFSPDAKTLAAATGDAVVRIWDLDTGAMRTLVGHDKWLRGVAFAPTGTSLISWSEAEETVRMWSGTATRVLRARGTVLGAAFNRSGDLVATTDDAGYLSVFESGSLWGGSDERFVATWLGEQTTAVISSEQPLASPP